MTTETQDSTALAPVESTGLAIHDNERQFATVIEHATRDLLGTPTARDALTLAVVHEFRRTPGLKKCSLDSIAACAIACAELGLYPSGTMAHVHLIPRGGEATLQIGYRGYMELARNAGTHIDTVGVVYADEVERGLFTAELAPFSISHRFSILDIDRSDKQLVAAYASGIVGGVRIGVILTRAQIDSRMKKGGAVWKAEFAAMARKSAIKALCNGGQVPLSPVVLNAMGNADPDYPTAPAPVVKAIDIQPEPTNPTEAAQAALGGGEGDGRW